MWRMIRRLLLVLVVAAVVAVTAVGVTARPDLERRRDDAVQHWRPLREPLDARYAALADLNDAVREAGGPERDVTGAIDTALAAWRASGDAPVARQVDTANDLEGLARRLLATIADSARLHGAAAVSAAADAFAGQPIPESARAFNSAARDYRDARAGVLREPVAGLLGHDPLPLLDTGGAAGR